MSDSALKQPRHMNRLSWFILSALLLLALVGGAFAFLEAHAASPPDGTFAFRAITTGGPKTGLYLTGQLNLTVSGNTITGGLCGYSAAPGHCATLQLGETPDNVNVAFSIHEIGNMPAVQVIGTFSSTFASVGGFTGSFSFSSTGGVLSSGHWQAGRVSTVPSASGVWYVYGLYTSGIHKGLAFHAVLTLVQTTDTQFTGTYCPTPGSCLKVTGGDHQGHLYMYFYVGAPPTLEFRGNFTVSHRANGQFQVPGPGGTLIELGYWLAH